MRYNYYFTHEGDVGVQYVDPLHQNWWPSVNDNKLVHIRLGVEAFVVPELGGKVDNFRLDETSPYFNLHIINNLINFFPRASSDILNSYDEALGEMFYNYVNNK